MKQSFPPFALARTLALSIGLITSASAQGTAFTYQGFLTDQGAPANGVYDLRFAVFDALSGGSPVGSTIDVDDLSVLNGLFTATLDPGANVFTGAARWLNIGVRPGDSTGAYTDVAPRHALTASPYAIKAITADTATTAAVANSVAAGAVGSAQLAPGAAAANLAASGLSGVASGGLVLSATENAAWVDAGYLKAGSIALNELWSQRARLANERGSGHTAVWTGSEMIVWGGYSGGASYQSDGGRYNPARDSWTNIFGVTPARAGHTAVWTGSEMIVWGGSNGPSFFNDGGRYNPVTGTWRPMSLAGAPAGRMNHTAVWTGSEMIVWGGRNGPSYFNDGSRYNPTSDNWTPVTPVGAPGPHSGLDWQ